LHVATLADFTSTYITYLHSMSFLFLFYCSCHHLSLHSFPTRRSSDLASIFHAKRNIVLNCSTNKLVIWILKDHTYIMSNFPNSLDRKSTRLNSSHVSISYAVFCLKKKKKSKYRKRVSKANRQEPEVNISA